MSRKKHSDSYWRKKLGDMYIKELDRLVDDLFQRAYNDGFTWADLARASGVSYSTVKKLGTRETRIPQYRSLLLIARALGGTVQFSEKKGRKMRVTWHPTAFAA